MRYDEMPVNMDSVLCPYHPRWTHLCEHCEQVERNRRLLRANGHEVFENEHWIVDPMFR